MSINKEEKKNDFLHAVFLFLIFSSTIVKTSYQFIDNNAIHGTTASERAERAFHSRKRRFPMPEAIPDSAPSTSPSADCMRCWIGNSLTLVL
jgi:hypothetical protein